MPRKSGSKLAYTPTQFKFAMRLREELALDDLRVRAALYSKADVIRLALQNLCDHYNYDRDAKLFGFRDRPDPRKST